MIYTSPLCIALAPMLLFISISKTTHSFITPQNTNLHIHHRHVLIHKQPTTFHHSSQLHLFNNFNLGTSSSTIAQIPKSTNERDTTAIQSIKTAISKPSNQEPQLIECEFPVLSALNKLGDGSLRSTIEAENANIQFVGRLVKGIRLPLGLVPNVNVLVSSSASNSFLVSVKKKVKGNGVNVYSMKDGIPSELSTSSSSTSSSSSVPDNICLFITPSSSNDYKMAKSIVEFKQTKAVVIINAFAKDPKSIPSTATMAYFLKPLTYNSQIAGYLIRSYPSSWTVLDAQTKQVLGTFSDQEILVKNTNTPDLRGAGRLVQKSVDERAIRARQR